MSDPMKDPPAPLSVEAPSSKVPKTPPQTVVRRGRTRQSSSEAVVTPPAPTPSVPMDIEESVTPLPTPPQPPVLAQTPMRTTVAPSPSPSPEPTPTPARAAIEPHNPPRLFTRSGSTAAGIPGSRPFAELAQLGQPRVAPSPSMPSSHTPTAFIPPAPPLSTPKASDTPARPAVPAVEEPVPLRLIATKKTEVVPEPVPVVAPVKVVSTPTQKQPTASTPKSLFDLVRAQALQPASDFIVQRLPDASESLSFSLTVIGATAAKNAVKAAEVRENAGVTECTFTGQGTEKAATILLNAFVASGQTDLTISGSDPELVSTLAKLATEKPELKVQLTDDAKNALSASKNPTHKELLKTLEIQREEPRSSAFRM